MDARISFGDQDVAEKAVVGIAVFCLFMEPYFFANSRSPMRYLLPDLGLLALFSWRFRSVALRKLGLAVSAKHTMIAFLALIIGTLITQEAVHQISATRGIQIVGEHRLFSLSQVLHQEIVLRAILLGWLLPWFKSDTALAVCVAILFAGIHPLYFFCTDGVVLPVSAITTLLAFGLATNLLFLGFGHIAFSFAAHAAWNLARFGDGYLSETKGPISEAQSYVEFEGSSLALGLALTFLALVISIQRIARYRA